MGVILDGTSVLYVCTLIVQIIIWIIIFARREYLRHRNNAARVRPQIDLSARISSKKAVNRRENQLDNVIRLRQENQARLTDCVALQFHSDKPYIHRMIAVDEVDLEIDGQLQRIEKAVHRFSGESTYSYLKRIREKVPKIPMNIINRISFLQESARYRPEKFDVEHVMELRSLLNQFLKILSAEYTSLQNESPAAPRGVIASFYEFGQRIMPTNSGSKRRRNKFGGSDGVRLLIKEREEHTALLSPLAAMKTNDSPTAHIRRQSDSNSALLPQKE